MQNRPPRSSSNHFPNPLNTPSDPPTAANRLNLPRNRKHIAAAMLPENRLEHRWHFAAANHVRLIRMRQDAAYIHTSARWSCWYKSCKHGTRRSEICWMWLNSWTETITDPAKHHYSPYLCTNFLRKQRTVVSDPCKAMNFERNLTTDISSDFMQSKVGWGVQLTLQLVCHRQSTKGFTSQWSCQQIKNVILSTR